MADPGQDKQVSAMAMSLIRTWAPMLAGWVLEVLAVRWHVVLDGHTAGWAQAAAVAVLGAAYYALARWLETRAGSSWFATMARGLGRVLLVGSVHLPVYVPRGQGPS